MNGFQKPGVNTSQQETHRHSMSKNRSSKWVTRPVPRVRWPFALAVIVLWMMVLVAPLVVNAFIPEEAIEKEPVDLTSGSGYPELLYKTSSDQPLYCQTEEGISDKTYICDDSRVTVSFINGYAEHDVAVKRRVRVWQFLAWKKTEPIGDYDPDGANLWTVADSDPTAEPFAAASMVVNSPKIDQPALIVVGISGDKAQQEAESVLNQLKKASAEGIIEPSRSPQLG